ncbi:MAG: GntG family PLP-dependent aldolase, partial [Anaerolineae bacterium]
AERKAAERLGKAAGLFVVSGTMGNLVSLLTHCGRGTEAIMGDKAHTFLYEAGGSSALGGIHVHTVPNQPDGTLRAEDVEAAVRADNVHFPRTALLCLENTHNRCGGVAISPEQMAPVVDVARRHDLAIHLDGARIFNAGIALGIDVAELARLADSVQFCFSKGLAAPIGSMVVGSDAFIGEARRNRKIVGGGMRQAGLIAAAAEVAMDTMVDRLAEDHVNARILAEGLAEIPGFAIDLGTVQTNIVIFGCDDPTIPSERMVGAWRNEGVLLNAMGPGAYRAVTHYGITRDDIDAALLAAPRVMALAKAG